MRYILFVIFFCISTILLSQDSRLANEYYQSGEYEKAASIYKRLYDAQPNSYFYFGRYIESLLALDQYQNAELEILRQIDKQPTHMQLYVTLGNVRERQFRPDEAEDAYRQAIANIPPDISVISNLVVGLCFNNLLNKGVKARIVDIVIQEGQNKNGGHHNRRQGTPGITHQTNQKKNGSYYNIQYKKYLLPVVLINY